MARVHYWQFLVDEDGKPIEGANVSIFLANSEELAYIFLDEIGGAPLKSSPQLKTNMEGFFEFWIGDTSEKNGYSSTQKFKLHWERIGIAAGMIDYVDIFPPTMPVNTNDDNEDRNKSVSNKLAKGWEEHRLSINHIVHGINEFDHTIDTLKRNKLISNRYGILWNNHRLMNFNTHVISLSGEDSYAPWEDINDLENYGAHGLQSINISGNNASDTVYNKLMNNALGNKWNEHVDFNFNLHTIGTSGFDNSAHGLKPVDFGTISYLVSGATLTEIEEFNKFNKLVSNRLIREIYNNLTNKPSMFCKTIQKELFQLGTYNEGWYYTIVHGLKSVNVGCSFYKNQERILEDGKITENKALFVPANVYILNENEILVYVNEWSNFDVVIWAQTDKIDELE